MTIGQDRGRPPPLPVPAAPPATADPAFLAHLVENAPDALVVVDAEGRIVLVNAQTEILFGYGRAELLGQPVELLVPERLRPSHAGHRGAFHQDSQPRAMADSRELMGRRKGGYEVRLTISLAPFRSAERSFVATCLRDASIREEAATDIQAAILNILDDFSADKQWLEATQAAVLNILDDFNEEKRKVSDINVELRNEVADRSAAEQRLTESLREKDVLLKEVHHRVKNNLQLVSSLLSLQGRYAQDQSLGTPLAEAQGRVLAIALVHEKLYQSDDLAQIDFRNYVSKLAAALLDSSSGRVALEIDMEHIALPVNQAIPCGLIVNELVTNAFKHAFPENGAGTVKISLGESGDERRLSVCDDGVGLPPGLNVRTSPSLGLQLVFMLARQLGAEVQVSSEAGTRFDISFWEEGE